MLKVAIIQINSSANKDENLEKTKLLIKEAALAKANFIFLPEVFNLRANEKSSIETAEKIPQGKSTQLLIELAKKYQVHISNGSIFEESDNTENPLPYNSSILINPNGELIAKYRKIHLFDVELKDQEIKESKKSQAGNKPYIADLKDFKIGLSICYDLRFPELYLHYAKEQTEVLLVPSSFTHKTGKAHWHNLLKARAIENQAFVIAANQCGSAGSTKAYGHSLIIDPWGETLAEADAEKEEIIYADLDFAKQKEIRKAMPIFTHRVL